MASVSFQRGTRAQYDKLSTKDSNTLYWLTDTQELLQGEILFGKGLAATQQSIGLMSPTDKQKLDGLSQSTDYTLTAVDSTVLITSNKDGSKEIGVQLSGDEGNILSIHKNGLFAAVESIPIASVQGLEERLTALAQNSSGGAALEWVELDDVVE
jgi:hypothetical protein